MAYVVNFGKNDGFAILSANRRIPSEVIAIIDTGAMDNSFRIANSIENGISTANNGPFVEKLLRQYILGGDRGSGDDDTEHEETGDGGDGGGGGGSGGSGGGNSTWITYRTIPPMLNYYWKQREPLNLYCPSGCPAGCVPVALAMILTYNRYPESITMNGRQLSWSLMNNSYYYNGYTIVNTDPTLFQGVDDLAFFIRQIGIMCGTIYTSGWAFTTPESAKSFLRSFGYIEATKHIGYDEDIILPMIEAGKPVFIAAISGAVDGHAWVIDGLISQSKNYDTRHLFHCNWGWEGYCNGYYESGIFDTTQGPVSEDPGLDGYYSSSTSDYDFDWWYRIITY